MSLPTIKAALPEVYQIEATSACNFNCTMCYRDLGPRKGENSYFPVALAETMLARGDFTGSYFVEFQLSGEPLMHPQLAELISVVKRANVLVGMSTNGSLLHRTSPVYERSLRAVALLDALTVSVDSVNDTKYQLQRVNKAGFTPAMLVEVVDDLVARFPALKIDLQIIEIGDWQPDLAELMQLRQQRWPNAVVRTAPDCFLAVRGDETELAVLAAAPGICINPWLSVTVQSNGDVVSCCFDFHGDNVYGSLQEQSLAAIWAKSDQLWSLREKHMTGELPTLCRQCYMRSPAKIHMNLIKNWAASRTSTEVRGTF